ncbi:TIGR03086 family metal-binding protein [Streptomyces sp. NPDC048301]|uniref:TIGR03086 family metal-binding protein n=1 Tax=Streptomyces sp. NPDC048301 TaxID=3155631 RepID=UPI0034156E8D
MKTISELLEEAAAQAVPVVKAIEDDQLTGGTPCTEYDVRALLNHLFLVVDNFTVLAAKGTPDFSRTDDVVTGDWRGRFDEATTRLVKAWAEPGAEEGVSGGMGLPARTVGFMVLGDLMIHVWDLAKATGQDYVPDPALAAQLEPELAALAPQAREAKVFGEAFPAPPGATAFERVLAETGRDPDLQPLGR